MPAAQKTEDPRLAIGANDPPEEAKLSITDLVAQSPAIVLTDEEKRAELYAHIEADIAAFEPDLTTAKGRDAIGSFAFKITKTKTAIDNAGKAMNEAARAQINVVDAARRDARNTLEILAGKARAPLTEWEEAELARNNRADDLIHRLRALAVVSAFDTSADLRKQGTEAFEMVLSADELGDRLEDVQRVKDETVASLKESLARVLREEADKAELARLRAETAERDRIDAERVAAEQAVQAKRDYARSIIEYIGEVGLGMIGGKTYPYVILIRELEEKITASEEEFGDMAGDVEKARVETLARVKDAQTAQAERARKEAEEVAATAARVEAEQTAERKRAEESAAAQAELDAANERAWQAEEDARRQRQQAERAEQERVEAAEREAAEQRKREANRAHRSRVMSEAKAALMTCGADEETAKKIVLAIVAGEIPAVTLAF